VYQYYDITLQGTDTVTLTYKLEQHRPAQVWAGLMLSSTPNQLRANLNPWCDFDKSLLPLKVFKLLELVDLLNQWLPESNKIKSKWNHKDHQGSANKFHIHFPEQEKNESDTTRLRQLAEYNDLIHEIETLAKNVKPEFPHLLICPDIPNRVPLEDNDYSLFKVNRVFGELCLHYCHVGRHPYELFSARDINCPIEQIVPQRDISSFHTLRFYTDNFTNDQMKPHFHKFYESSTLKQVIGFDDPKMAFGYIPLGKLVTSKSLQEVVDQVKLCDKIIDWQIY
jgi:hypothetical protein